MNMQEREFIADMCNITFWISNNIEYGAQKAWWEELIKLAEIEKG